MSDIRVLLDGWALAYQPNGPAALHLQTLFDHWPDEIHAAVAQPAEIQVGIPEKFTHLIVKTNPTNSGRIHWEQRIIPKLAKEAGAQIIHLTSGTMALFGSSANLLSPAGERLPESFAEPRQDPGTQHTKLVSLIDRLEDALLEGGLSRLSGGVWPADLPVPKITAPLYQLPAAVPQLFWETEFHPSITQALDLPDDYVLYHGPASEADLRLVLDGWRWVTRALGDSTMLVAVSLDEQGRKRLQELAYMTGLDSTVRALPELSVDQLAATYRHSRLVYHPVRLSPWGDALHLALAYARPVVALESAWTDARLGPAAYLTPPEGRALGAAIVTVLGEDDVAEALSNAAKKRSAAFRAAGREFREGLRAIYRKLGSRDL